jgi:hypothetical protein
MELKASLGELVRQALRQRPAPLQITSASVLYADFDKIFLGGVGASKNVFQSGSGHRIKVLRHHFFHLVQMTHPLRGDKLQMCNEWPIIQELTTDFGPYVIDECRATSLPSAHQVLVEPDAVLSLTTPGSATHCFYRFYGGGPSPYTVTLVRAEGSFMLPITSYPTNAAKVRKFSRNGDAIIWQAG